MTRIVKGSNASLDPQSYLTGLEASTVEPLEVMTPTFFWVNGDVRGDKGRISHTGGWFIGEDQAKMVEPFQSYTHVTVDGKLIQGYAAGDVTLALLYVRKSWALQGENGIQRFPWNISKI